MVKRNELILMCLYRIRAPSYFVDNETPQGLMLHYRSKRRGFTTYTIGQLKAVAETYYKMEVAIEVKESEIKFDTVHVSFLVQMRALFSRFYY